jgi:hypothetical protein
MEHREQQFMKRDDLQLMMTSTRVEMCAYRKRAAVLVCMCELLGGAAVVAVDGAYSIPPQACT